MQEVRRSRGLPVQPRRIVFNDKEVQAAAHLASGLCVGAAAEYAGLHRMDVVRLVDRLNRIEWPLQRLRALVQGDSRADIHARVEALLHSLAEGGAA
jgi:hypothetical protein